MYETASTRIPFYFRKSLGGNKLHIVMPRHNIQFIMQQMLCCIPAPSISRSQISSNRCHISTSNLSGSSDFSFWLCNFQHSSLQPPHVDDSAVSMSRNHFRFDKANYEEQLLSLHSTQSVSRRQNLVKILLFPLDIFNSFPQICIWFQHFLELHIIYLLTQLFFKADSDNLTET